MEPRELEERLDVVEIRLAHLEDFLNRLQDQVVARAKESDRIAAEHGAIKEKLVQIVSVLEEIPDRRPPHY